MSKKWVRYTLTAEFLSDAHLGAGPWEAEASREQRLHAFLATLLGIPHIVVCVNKMDLVDYSQDRFNEIRDEFRDVALVYGEAPAGPLPWFGRHFLAEPVPGA